MVKSVDEAREFAHVSGEEASVLAAAENAIVLLASRRDQQRCCDSLYSRDNGLVGTSSRCSWLRPALPLAAEVSPNLGHVGIMLPTSPLHLLLLQQAGVPCVVTSGNRNDEPLAFQNAVAEETLQAVADVWLHHDRPIVRPIDDSVVRVINRQSVTIRAARGIAPMSLNVKS